MDDEVPQIKSMIMTCGLLFDIPMDTNWLDDPNEVDTFRQVCNKFFSLKNNMPESEQASFGAGAALAYSIVRYK